MNKEKSTLWCFLIGLGLFLCGCVNSPEKVQVAPGDPLLIQTKAQIKNEDETNSVKIEIALLPRKAIRLEVSGTLGVSVASVLMTPQQISYALHSSKQFVRGPFHEKTLYAVFKKNIDPSILWKVIHNQSPANARIKCEVNANGQPVKCSSDDGARIQWTYDTPPVRRIDIISNRFEMNWIFKDQGLLKASQNETFVLKKPEDYKEIIIK